MQFKFRDSIYKHELELALIQYVGHVRLKGKYFRVKTLKVGYINRILNIVLARMARETNLCHFKVSLRCPYLLFFSLNFNVYSYLQRQYIPLKLLWKSLSEVIVMHARRFFNYTLESINDSCKTSVFCLCFVLLFHLSQNRHLQLSKSYVINVSLWVFMLCYDSLVYLSHLIGWQSVSTLECPKIRHSVKREVKQ